METGVTGGEQWFRAKARKSLRGNLGKHIMGDIRPVTAGLDSDDELAKEAPQIWLNSDGPIEKSHAGWNLEKAIDRLDFVRKLEVNHGRGRPPSGVFEFAAGGIRSDTKGPERIAWATATVKWLEEGLGPGSTIALAVLHNDETTPHIHVMAMVADENCKLGFTRVRDRLAGRPTKDHWDCGEALQDAYHENVSKHFGITRGERGAWKKRKEVDRAKAFKVFETRTKFRAQQKVDAAAEREAKAAKREEVNRQRTKELNEFTKSANAASRRLSARVSKIKNREQAVDARETKVNQAEQSVDARETEVKQVKQDAEEKLRMAAELDRKVGEVEEANAKRTAELAEFTKSANVASQMLSARERKVKSREQNVDVRESAVDVRESAVDVRESDVGKKEVAVRTKVAKVREDLRGDAIALVRQKALVKDATAKLQMGRDALADDLREFGKQANVNADLRFRLETVKQQAAAGKPVVDPKSPERLQIETEGDERRAFLAKAAGKKPPARRNPLPAPTTDDVEKTVRERLAPIDEAIGKIEQPVPAPERPARAAPKEPTDRGGRGR